MAAARARRTDASDHQRGTPRQGRKRSERQRRQTKGKLQGNSEISKSQPTNKNKSKGVAKQRGSGQPFG